MKRTKFILAIILLVVMAGCEGGNKKQTTDFITVDVNTTYPEKDLVLQDFMDIEYVALETTDEFITQGIVEDVGKNYILVRNRSDGNIFIFDRKTGKGIRKINRFGQGADEYSQLTGLILDEDNNELFVEVHAARKIMVYDLEGNFKRSFPFADTCYYMDVFNYDRDHLICYKTYYESDNETSFHILISKQDGSVKREIQVPFKEIKTPVITKGEATIMPIYFTTFPSQGDWVLMNTSADTIYRFSPDQTLVPFIARTPSIQSMDLEVFLFIKAITDRYYFMETMKKEVNEHWKVPVTDLVYDTQEKALFRYAIYNDDFSNRKQFYIRSKSVSQEVDIVQPLDAFSLVEAYEEDQLEGKLKEIAADLEEESNPVIMLIKYKK